MKRLLLAIILTAAVAPVWAQDDGGDAPDHGVARLSMLQGNVSVRHGDAGEMTAGAVNAPLLATDRVETGDGRAEIQFDAVNMIRLAPSTEVRLSELQYKRYQVQIAEGTTTFRVLRDNDAQVEISTPTVSLRPVRAGIFRITVEPDGLTIITARQGAAEIFGPRGSENLSAGQTMEARGSASDPEFHIVGGIPNDEWDRWNADRDRTFQQVTSGRYVSPDVYGTESLDPYGQWRDDPQYGNVWVPSVSPDWAPYQEGRWSWVDYYGWTWVSADPWGWAPYHYGRWYRASYGWAWWPGAIGPRYYWRPALVGFVGWGGGGFGLGFGFGNVGWVPLAPYEVYRPWYGRGFAGGGRVNIINNTNVTNVYRNARYTNSVTSVRAEEFGRGSVHQGNIVRASSGDLARAGAVNGAMPFTPTAASRRLSDAQVSSRGMPQASANRQFYSRSAGQPGQGQGAAPFGGQVNRGTPRGNTPQSTFNAPSVNNAPPGNGNGAAGQVNRAGGWRSLDNTSPQQRANSPQSTPQSTTPAPAAASPNGGGWRRLDNSQQRGAAPQANYNPQPRSSAAPQSPQSRTYSAPQNSQSNYNPQPRSYSAPNPSGTRGYAPQYEAPSRSYSAPQNRTVAPQNPVRISPPIVQNRGAAAPASHPDSHAGNFGGAHAGGGGAPRSGGGGGNGGGGNRGGGHR